MNEIAWARYTEDMKKAEHLFDTIQELYSMYPEEMRIRKARLHSVITDDEAALVRRFYNDIFRRV